MPWRNWSVIIVLILANYVVFSIIGALLFPATPAVAPTHVPRPTFTSAAPPKRASTLRSRSWFREARQGSKFLLE